MSDYCLLWANVIFKASFGANWPAKGCCFGVPMRTPAVCEPVESRRLMATQTLNFTSNSEVVVMWHDSAGYNRFGPSAGTTYYFDSTGSNPVTTPTSGTIYHFTSSYTAFTVYLNGGNDKFSVNSNVTAAIALTLDGGSGNDRMDGGNGSDTFYCGNDNKGSDTCLGGNGHDFFYFERQVPENSYIDSRIINDGATDGITDTIYTHDVV
ncbi:MAG: hypothetical protein QM754_21240 [Tepidisphaeraceae bacterium]